MTTRPADKDTELLEKRFRKSPESRLFSRLADNYRKVGNFSRAIELCLEGIQKHPDYVTGHIILGHCYFEQKKYNEAFEIFKKVCTIDRHNQIALKMLAEIFVRQNMNQKAGCIYQVLHNLNPYNKAIAKLVSQYPSDGITDLYDILGIEIHAEPALWEHSSDKQQIPEEQTAYGSGEESDNFLDDASSLQQSFDENESFPADIPFDNEKTVAVDSDSISQHLNVLFEEDQQTQDNSFDSFIQENSNNEEIQNLESSVISEDDIKDNIEEDTDITGQDISSRIDELFSEKTDSFNNSTLKAMPQIISEEDSSETIEQLVQDKTVALDPSTIPSDSVEQSSSKPEPDLEQQQDLIIEQPRPFEDINPFTGKNVLSEFEETMQFERSFLENVIDSTETIANNEVNENTGPFINQDLIADASGEQEISEIGSSEKEPFDPSQILIDTNQDNDVSQPEPKIENSTDHISLIHTDEQQLSDPFLSQAQDPNQNLITKSDDVILENYAESDTNLPEIVLTNNENSSSIEPISDSTIEKINETDSYQEKDEVTDKNQDFLLSEELSDNAQTVSDNSFLEKTDSSFPSDSQEDILDQVFPETGPELTEESYESLQNPDNSSQETPCQDNISQGKISNFEDSSNPQTIDIAPDLPILEDELDSTPEEFLSLANDNERNILIDSVQTNSHEDSLEDSDKEIIDEQDKSFSTAYTPEKEVTGSNIESDEINNKDDLAIIDTDSDLEELSVENDDDVLTDMDVLVSDDVLKSVSGDDIVEKMDMLFPDDKHSAEVKPVDNLPAIENTDSSFPASSIEDISDNLDQELSIISDPETFGQTENIPPQQTFSNDDVPIDIVSNGSEPDSNIDKREQESTSIISGQDVMDRLEQFFPGKDLLNTGSELLPSDDHESEDMLTDFYTIFGDNAVNSQSVEGLDKLDQLEMIIPEKSDKPLSFYDEWNDACSLQDQNENETFKEKVQKSVEKTINENIPLNQSPAEEEDDIHRPYNIPDHVLTPTLADIYFQQGQHDLAIQIYRRLLSRDPDNENLQQKLNQLLEMPAGIPSNNLYTDNQTTKNAASSNSPEKKKKTVVDNRPLAGVRIKKRKNGGANRTKTK
jgi:tetratricopeptide (TPR) repeat protein